MNLAYQLLESLQSELPHPLAGNVPLPRRDFQGLMVGMERRQGFPPSRVAHLGDRGSHDRREVEREGLALG